MEEKQQQDLGRFLKLRRRVGRLPRWMRWFLGMSIPLLLLAGFYLSNRDKEGLVVQTAKVENQAIERSVMSNGCLEVAEKQEFFTPEDSTLMELSVEVGDRVTKGQVLGRLDTQELGRLYQEALAKLAGLEADLVRSRATNDQLNLRFSEAAYNKAQKNLDRISLLYKEGAVPINELEQAKIDFSKGEADYKEALIKAQQGASQKQTASLQAQVALGQQEVAKAKERLDLANFVANEAGVVLFVGTEKGNRVLEGTRILEIGNDKKLEVTAKVNEIDAGTLKVGQPVKITCNSIPDKEFSGEVTRVSAVAISETTTNNNAISVPVTVQLKGDTGGLKPGYTVEVNVITMKEKKFLVIPFEAMVTKNGEKFVYVVEKGIAKKRKVVTEQGNELYDIVLSGLKAGEEIILTPPSSIQEGQMVSTGEQHDQGK